MIWIIYMCKYPRAAIRYSRQRGYIHIYIYTRIYIHIGEAVRYRDNQRRA